MSQYLILIYDDAAALEDALSARDPRIMQGHADFGDRFEAAVLAGDALQPASSATSIRPDAR